MKGKKVTKSSTNKRSVTLESLSRQIEVVAFAVADLTNKVSRLEGSVEEIKFELVAVENRLAGKIMAIDRRIDALTRDYVKKDDFVKLTKRVSALETR